MSQTPKEPTKKPPKNALTESDKSKLLNAIADLPFVHRTPKNHDYMRDLMLTVLDFHAQAEVVGKAINHFRDRVQPLHCIETHEDLTRVLTTHPDTREGNTEASLFLWGNRHWQRVHLLRGLLTYFESIGITDRTELRRWATTADFDKDFKNKVKGLGLAVFHWLLIRCGVPTVKPDVWVFNFVHRITGKKLADTALVEVFKELAPLVGESQTSIDMTIWASERMGLMTNDAPGLRQVWWMHVYREIGSRFQDDKSLRDGYWNITCDGTARTRYDRGGIRMTAMMRWAEQDQPVETLVQLMQSGWLERFRVILTVIRDLPTTGLEEVKTRLEAATWVVTAHGHLEASMDMDTSLLMPPTVTIEFLMKTVHRITDRTVAAIKTIAV